MIILNNPNNPSGVLYNNADLNKIAEVFREYPNILFVSDDIYDMIYWADQPAQMLNVAPDLSDRIIIANGISKSYAMSGWRIGYIIAPEDITKAMIKFQSQSLSNPCSVSQKAAVPALNMSYTSLLPHVRTYQKRVERVYKWLSELEGVSCLKTEGTFYLFPNIEGVMKQKGISSDIEFCERLLDQAKVALTPGSAFGLNGYVRITCSFDDHILEEGLKRFKKFVS